MHRIALLLAISLALSGCARQSTTPCCVEVPTHPVATVQPMVVSVLPVRMPFESPLPWHLEEELAEQIASALRASGSWEVAPMESALWQAALLDAPFSPDLSDYERLAGGSDFVVVSELVEHKDIPYRGQKMQSLYTKDGDVDTVLAMKLRVRVVDLRTAQPRIVLQEVVHSNHMVRKHERSVDYRQIGWGSSGYEETAVGVAHRRLAEELAGRIDRYASFMR